MKPNEQLKYPDADRFVDRYARMKPLKQVFWSWLIIRFKVKEAEVLPKSLIFIRKILFPIDYLRHKANENYVPGVKYDFMRNEITVRNVKWGLDLLGYPFSDGKYVISIKNKQPEAIYYIYEGDE